MPKIHQYADHYAEEAFHRELRLRQGYYGLMTNKSLAQAIDIPPSTLHGKLRNMGSFTVNDFRKIIKTVHPDPAVILALLGYTKKEISQFKKQ